MGLVLVNFPAPLRQHVCPGRHRSDTERSKSRTFINPQLSESCQRKPHRRTENPHVSIPRSRRPWILFYHLIHFNSATSGLADLGQICIQAALSGSPRTIHHCRVNRNSSENTFITQSTGKKDDLLGQAGRPSKTAVCHSKFRQSSEMTSSNASISVQHLQNGTIKTLSYPADPPGKEVTCVGIFMGFFFRKASSFLDGVY